MQGESINQAEITELGLLGDRLWAVRDTVKDEIATVRRFPKLLRCQPAFKEEPSKEQFGNDVANVEITLPDGQTEHSSTHNDAPLLSEFLGRPVTLCPRQPRKNWRFYRSQSMDGEAALKKQFNTRRALPDMSSISWKKLLELTVFVTPLGHLYDIYPLHILTSNSLNTLKQIEPKGDFQIARFRPNLYIDSNDSSHDFEEFQWVGGKLYIGEVILKCESKTVRCSMPAQPQVDLERDRHILPALETHSGRHLGINVSIIKGGHINTGDTVYWQAESHYSLARLLRPLSSTLRNWVIKGTLKLTDVINKTW